MIMLRRLRIPLGISFRLSLLRPMAASLLALAALVLPLFPGVPSFWVALLDLIGLASLVALGLVVLTGVGGMTSFGQAALVGIGAYSSAVLTTGYGLSPWVSLPVALLATMAVGLAIGLLTVRLSGHYLPLGTIAWGMAVFSLFGNIQAIGGYNGISGIPPLSVAGSDLYDSKAVYPLVWATVLAAAVATTNLLNSRYGRAMRAMRGGTKAAEAFGVEVPRVKLLIFVYAAALAGLSGWLFAHIQRAVTPTAFGLNAGIEYLLMAVLGGAGHVYGALVGAGLVILLKNGLQDLLPALFGGARNYETIVFGVLLVLALQGARDGLWPHIAALFGTGRAASRREGVPPAAPAGILPSRPHESAGAEPLLRVEGVCKRFGGLVAVNQVDFVVGRGEILTLLGPNGAGKSTTFNLITGCSKASAGIVRFRETRIDGCSPGAVARLGLARTFQHVKLIQDMTVIENVALGAHLRGRAGFLAGMLKLDRTEEAAIFAEAARQLRRVGLGDCLDSPAGSLSLGQSRLVEIARALCLEPALLLLDEPAAGLRRLEKKRLGDLLADLRGEGMSILLVEHDMEFVMALTDRIVVLNFGNKIAEGLPSAIQADAKVREAYLGGVA